MYVITDKSAKDYVRARAYYVLNMHAVSGVGGVCIVG